MADGWRNRFWAPVCALVISFVFVFILGFALNDPTQIRFVIAGQNESRELPDVFQDLRVRVNTTVGEQLDGGHVGRSGEFTLLNPHQDIRICTNPPDGWSVAGATVVSEESCLRRTAPGDDEDVVITLVQREG